MVLDRVFARDLDRCTSQHWHHRTANHGRGWGRGNEMSQATAMEPKAAKKCGRWRSRIVLVFLVAVALPLGATLLYSHSPTEYTFYPRCLLFLLTGLHCPGCGSTRCAAALLHGDIEQAFAYNPLMV